MASVKEVESSIQTARQELQEERQKIAKQRKELSKAEKERLEKKRELPQPTQRTLRSGLFAGLEGRKRRRQVSEAKEGLKKDISQINLFQKGIKEREEKLGSWEKEIEKKEKELEEYKKDKAYRELAWKIASDQVSGGLMGRLPKKYQEMARKWSDELEQSKATHIKAYQKSFEPKQPETSKIEPTSGILPKPIYDDKGKLVGIDDPIKKQSRLPTPSEKITYGGGFKSSIPEFEQKKSFKPPRNLPRTVIVKDFSKMKDFDFKTTKVDALFRTTGSPIRMTKLTSLKPKGYIPDKKPTKEIKPTFKKVKPTKTKKKTNIFGFKDEDNIFSKGKNKKSKRKKSLWGW